MLYFMNLVSRFDISQRLKPFVCMGAYVLLCFLQLLYELCLDTLTAGPTMEL